MSAVDGLADSGPADSPLQALPDGLIIAAPASGSGKTTITLGLLRALSRRGHDVASAKTGPDYIDPAFHAAATGRPCPNLDSWAMRPGTFAATCPRDAALVLVEGVMGLFDGAASGDVHDPLADGSTASIARRTGWPVVLVVDAARQAQSVAALVAGFAGHDPAVRLAGVILNRVASARHEAMLRRALGDSGAGFPVLGAVGADRNIARPGRHLGLVQAGEHADLEAFLERAADRMEADTDLGAIVAVARPGAIAHAPQLPLPPMGQHIAIARDAAFSFAYPHVLEGWRAAGAVLSFFSPLADEAPAPDSDAVFLPGGYPELHAGRLAAAGRFAGGLRRQAAAGAAIHGECGGYMVLGTCLTDADGQAHVMPGLLPHRTSFAAPRRHLGYRRATLCAEARFGPAGSIWRGHEFHYASVEGPEEEAAPLFRISDAAGADLGTAGGYAGAVSGSFLHLIDRAES